MNIAKPEVPRPYEMVTDAILAKPTERNNFAISYRILMKFETDIHFALFNVNIAKSLVPRPHKMAADAILVKLIDLNNSFIYYLILMKFETRVHFVPLNVNNSKSECHAHTKWRPSPSWQNQPNSITSPFIVGFWWNLKHRYVLCFSAWISQNRKCHAHTKWPPTHLCETDWPK